MILFSQAMPTSIMMNELVTLTVIDGHATLFSPSGRPRPRPTKCSFQSVMSRMILNLYPLDGIYITQVFF
jgi:hypothetical protein